MIDRLRPARPEDLDAINGVIERAVMTWSLPERVKRLSLPSYRLREDDFHYLKILVAEREGRIVGVAAMEAADPKDCPKGSHGLLLYGLYVEPRHQGEGIGRKLLEEVVRLARQQGHDGLLVKAQKDAEPFFERMGMVRLAVEDASRDYQGRYWMAL